MRFNDLKLRTKLFSGFIIVAALVVLVGLVGWTGLHKQEAHLNEVAGIRMQSIEALLETKVGLEEIILAQRTFLLPTLGQEDRQEQLQEFNQAREHYAEAWARFESLPKSQAEQNLQQDFNELLKDWVQANDEWWNSFQNVTFNQGQGNQDYLKASADVMNSIRDTARQATDIIDELVAVNQEQAGKSIEQARSDAAFYGMLMIIGVILGTILAVAFGMVMTMIISRPVQKVAEFAEEISQGNLDADFDIKQKDEIGVMGEALKKMVRNLKKNIAEARKQSEEAREQSKLAEQAMQEAREQEAQVSGLITKMKEAASDIAQISDQVSTSSEEISAQVEQSSRGAEQQKQRVQETASAMEEMNATILEVARNASSAAKGADNSKNKANEGHAVVDEVIRGIKDIQDKSQALKKDMSALGHKAEEIGRIMDVIDDIADQTNLLALNAAIEAARAGEAGRGFAVVADEVRKLAEKTMKATDEVEQAIGGIQEDARRNTKMMDEASLAVEKATELAEQSGGVLKEIVEEANNSAEQITSIATASEQQSSASEEVNRSVEEINQIASETSDVMNQSAQAVTDLSRQALDLKNMISELNSESGGEYVSK